MKLFGKKKAEKKVSCCGQGNLEKTPMKTSEKCENIGGALEIKVLGSGCAKCSALETATKDALAEMQIFTEIDHVTDFAEIATYGVMRTPALVVNEKVVSYGKVLKKQEVIALLQKVCGV